MKNQRPGFNIVDQYAAYFVTFTIVGWVDVFTRKASRDIFINALKYCVAHKGLIIHAYVIMSNHVHLAIRAKEGSKGLSNIIRDLKGYTSRKLLKWILSSPKERRNSWMEIVFKYYAKYNLRNKNYQLWIQNNHPVELSNPQSVKRIINYIHNNPVAACITDTPEAYIYSSARNYFG